MKKLYLPILAIFFMSILGSGNCLAELHPLNKRLVALGYMPTPKYYPQIPRIPSTYALSLYEEGKALFVYISASTDYTVLGGVHLTEAEAWSIDPNKLPFKNKDQVLVVYCP